MKLVNIGGEGREAIYVDPDEIMSIVGEPLFSRVTLRTGQTFAAGWIPGTLVDRINAALGDGEEAS